MRLGYQIMPYKRVHLMELIQVLCASLMRSSINALVFDIVEQAPSGSVLIDNLLNHLYTEYESVNDNFYVAIGNPLSPGISVMEVRKNKYSNKEQLVIRSGHSGPDREALCNSRGRSAPHAVAVCDITLLLLHGNRQSPSYTTLTLRILDKNDNTPEFMGGNILKLRVPEDNSLKDDFTHAYGTTGLVHLDEIYHNRAKKSRIFSLSNAFDADLPENGVKAYHLVTTSGNDVDVSKFQLVNGKRLDEKFSSSDSAHFSPALKINGPLDREEVTEHWLHLLATDSGLPQNTGTLTIHLIVTDVNDNYPSFRQPVYHQPVIRLPISELLHQHYKFSSEKYHHSIEKQTTDLQVLCISELLPPNTELVTLVADDCDEGDSARVSYRLKENDLAKEDRSSLHSFNLTYNNGSVTLRVANKLDADGADDMVWLDNSRENVGRLVFLSVEAFDAGSPSLTGSIDLNLLITNVNDNAPEISVHYVNPLQVDNVHSLNHTQMVGTFQENEATALAIAHLTVVDNDIFPRQTNQPTSLQNSAVYCMLNDSRFSIEQLSSLSSNAQRSQIGTTGQGNGNPSLHFFRLSTSRAMDREETQWVHIRVDCVDRVPTRENRFTYHPTVGLDQRTQLSGSSVLHFKILDVNDNSPEFAESNYQFTVMETPAYLPGKQSAEETRKFVGQLHAMDSDSGLNSDITYSLLDNPRDAFQLESDTGKLWCVRPLDHESEANIQLRVKAEDRGEPVQSSTATVIIYVGDINDNAPQWLTPDIYERSPQNHLGSLEDSVFYFSVYENARIGTVLGTIKAIDVDKLSEGESVYENLSNNTTSSNKDQYKYPGITYHLESVEEANGFRLNSRSGELQVGGPLDREKRAHHELRAFAIDGPPSLVSRALKFTHRYTITATVVISVLDVNDNSPQFERPLAGEDFYINPSTTTATAGARIFIAKAQDADAGENATIRYALGHDGFGLVEINPTTGFCYLSQTLHHSRMSAILNANKIPFTEKPSQMSNGVRGYKNLEMTTTTSGELKSFVLPLTIIAHDLGIVERLNNTRTVYLVWNADNTAGFWEGGGLKLTYSGSKVYSPDTGSSKLENVIIPTSIGVLLLLLITCVLSITIQRYRCRVLKTRYIHPSSLSSDQRCRWDCFKILLNSCSECDNVECNKINELQIRAKQGTHNESNLFNITAENCVSKTDPLNYWMTPLHSKAICSSMNFTLPDCIPSTERGTEKQVQMSSFESGRYTQNHYSRCRGTNDVAYVSGNKGSRLSRSFSEESISNTKTDLGYTSLSTVPPELSNKGYRLMPQFDKKDVDPYFYQQHQLHHLQLSPYVQKRFHKRGPNTDQLGLFTGQILMGSKQYPYDRRQDNYQLEFQAKIDQNSVKLVHPRNSNRKIESVQEYEIFECDPVDKLQTSQANRTAALGSGWRKQSQECYAENSLV